jgi:thioredoxin-like negative regulator of GroEL
LAPPVCLRSRHSIVALARAKSAEHDFQYRNDCDTCRWVVVCPPLVLFLHLSLSLSLCARACVFPPTVIELDEQNFEHLTQAATGATSGDWLVLFCKPSVARCSKVSENWQRVATTLAATREAKGLQRINVANVDTSNAPWLRKRFGIQSVPVVLFFKGGVMYSFHGGGFSVERLVQFAERDFERSNRMLVPPEPHVATPHDQTFLITIGTVAAGAAVLYVVDLILQRYYMYANKKKKAAKKAAAAAAKSQEGKSS